jgi:biotin carboxyl carrier protein
MDLPTEQFKLEVAGFEFLLTEKELQGVRMSNRLPMHFNMIVNNQTTDAVITPTGQHNEFTVEVDGEYFDVIIKDELQQQLAKMGFDKVSNTTLKEIKAPMPGLVVGVAVSVGQEVNAGDKLLTLEAMKMENNITVKAAVKIKKIWVAAGQAVEKGQVLVEFE